MISTEKLFRNSDYRKASGHTGYYELQFCETNLPVKKTVDHIKIVNWKDDSLYIDVMIGEYEIFYEHYDKFFGQFGKVNYFGVNYYTKEQTEKIYNDLKKESLPDIDTLLNWLEICIARYNGFYFLGV